MSSAGNGARGSAEDEGTEGTMGDPQVAVHRGRHVGWWVEGRFPDGRLFLKTWWPTQALAEAIGRLVGGRSAGGTP